MAVDSGDDRKPVVIRKLDQLPGLSAAERQAIEPVVKDFAFRVSPYYSGLIDWSDPSDPLRRIVLPGSDELDSDLTMDASDEAVNTKVRGLQHKYSNTALLLVNDFCAAYCRFCFRKRFTLATDSGGQILAEGAEKETTFDVSDGIEYIRQHAEIDNVLLTGGDPLMLAPSRLRRILDALQQIPHVKIVRIGTKVPAFDPARVTDEVISVLAEASGQDKRVYLMLHYNHPRELTAESMERVAAAQAAGLIAFNQTPILKGVNDDVSTLVALLKGLADNGIRPYYLFHCRPTMGDESYMMTLQEGEELVRNVRKQLNGLARGFRYVGSHKEGKIEIIGRLDDQLVLRFHQPRNKDDEGRLMLWPVDEPIEWFDEIVSREDVGLNRH